MLEKTPRRTQMTSLMDLYLTPEYARVTLQDRDEMQLDLSRAFMHASMTGGKLARILVVDDQADQAYMFFRALRASGYEAFCAYDGIAGLAAAWRTKPDLIVLNYLMPGMDGIEVLKRLRSAPDTKHIKVIITSAAREAERLAEEAGAEAFIHLPCDIPGLLGTLEIHLGRP